MKKIMHFKAQVYMFLLILILSSILSACTKYHTITWQDADGKILNTEEVEFGAIPEQELPDDSEIWDYTHWSPDLIEVDGDAVYTAERTLKKSYFAGIVFQIVVFDLGRQPIAFGTGFIYDIDGWFITNSHVIEEGYFAEAIFNIPDSSAGKSFTTLTITKGAYIDYQKDVFIGMVSDYSRIGHLFKELPFSTSHDAGDVTYSIGFPDASTYLQVNKGEITSDISSLYDKIYSGNSYIASTSYASGGSSGGILINDKLEILGMVTIGLEDDEGNFVLYGAIQADNYKHILTNITLSTTEDLHYFLHPENRAFIDMILYLSVELGIKGTVYDNYVSYKLEITDEGSYDGISYIYTKSITFDTDMYISMDNEFYWAGGDRRVESLFGYYCPINGLKNFNFYFKYTFGSGNYYIVQSSNINYSSNIELTLNNYYVSSNAGFTPSASNIIYAKNSFNTIYTSLVNIMG